MKEFNLEAAKAGAKVMTRDGRAMRIVCFDVHNSDYPLIALEKTIEGKENIHIYTTKGEYLVDTMNEEDLFMAPVKKEGWLNIYPTGRTFLYDLENNALRWRSDSCVTTIKIEWEE